MKQCWFGVALLTALLGLGLLTNWAMGKAHSPIAAQLEQSAELAMEEKWEQAAKVSLQARRDWEAVWHLTATVADHTPMEEIDGLFSELEIYAQGREAVHFAACCAQLSRRIQAMGEAHSPDWWNLL